MTPAVEESTVDEKNMLLAVHPPCLTTVVLVHLQLVVRPPLLLPSVSHNPPMTSLVQTCTKDMGLRAPGKVMQVWWHSVHWCGQGTLPPSLVARARLHFWSHHM